MCHYNYCLAAHTLTGKMAGYSVEQIQALRRGEFPDLTLSHKTGTVQKAVNGMMMDMLAAIARKDYEDRRRRQAEGIIKAKAEGKYRGRIADAQKHELIRTLRLVNGKSLRETARLAGVSKMTVVRVCNNAKE